MSIFKQPDFLTLRQLDIENKLYLPTTKLYDHISFKLNASYQDFLFQTTSLYQDICSVLSNTHTAMANTAKAVYDHPTETFSAWYEKAINTGNFYYTHVQQTVTPVFQNWQLELTTCKDKTSTYLQAFLDNPQQVSLKTIEPITNYITATTEQSQLYTQQLIANPEQYLSTAIAPITHSISAVNESIEVTLIGVYYALVDLANILLSQPIATLQALYHNTLAALLDIYFDTISSLLITL